MHLIRVGGVDPSLTHTGIAKGTYDLRTGEWSLVYVNIVNTETQTAKVVRKNSDDLRRGQEIARFIYRELADCDVIFSEIPTGAQSARAATAFGMVVGLLSGILESPGFKPAFVQVLPHEVKLSIPGGSKVTSKEEIVEWAVKSNPDAGWITGGVKSKYQFDGFRLTADNEHMADAAAVINAGVLTEQFRHTKAAFERAFSIRQEL